MNEPLAEPPAKVTGPLSGLLYVLGILFAVSLAWVVVNTLMGRGESCCEKRRLQEPEET